MNTRTVTIPATDTMKLHLLMDAWNSLKGDESVSDGVLIDKFSELIERVAEQINEDNNLIRDLGDADRDYTHPKFNDD